MERILEFFDSPFSNISENSINLSTKFSLDQNFPNPFNSNTTIKFSIAKKSVVTIEIFDIMGRQISTLTNKQYNPGYYKIVWNSAEYSSGMYFYKISAGYYSNIRKCLLLK